MWQCRPVVLWVVGVEQPAVGIRNDMYVGRLQSGGGGGKAGLGCVDGIVGVKDLSIPAVPAAVFVISAITIRQTTEVPVVRLSS